MGSAMKTALVGVSTAALLIISVHAQTPARLPWGDPDLEGIWTNATFDDAAACAGARDESVLHG